ncbi:hypothetical protein [Desertibacillus haloalkaliphilus]|uniref:hypothetical protein n=1 Tax=Desertibacillus haloalkaliphilus TaxID=1328930 RepID=UPI001C26E8C4|nr:hypothetical protein [Desertibacillus haloalkaliphilus]MBU8907388.1 hypothetical protein [Desertibacillus haloalkaliphilus]
MLKGLIAYFGVALLAYISSRFRQPLGEYRPPKEDKNLKEKPVDQQEDHDESEH